ncbi:MAG: AAA family ATPase [Gammaproteobacteria bacterium]
MYLAHFNLQEPPFALTPDPRYLYLSDRHREGLAHLMYGLEEGGGFVQLTGEIGTGKTTLCRVLLERLPDGVEVAFILNPRLTDIDLLATICDEFGIEYSRETATQKFLVDALYRHALEAHAQGRRTVLIIDEAQNLSPQVLEQVRLLTNLETTRKKLLQIILIGQPELIEILARSDLRQLAQRISARYHLLPFSRQETSDYIAHRLAIAGGGGQVFKRRARRLIHRAAQGLPRLINVYCDRALLGAFVRDQDSVTAGTARKAVAEVKGAAIKIKRGRWLAAAVALASAGSAAWWFIPALGPGWKSPVSEYRGEGPTSAASKPADTDSIVGRPHRKKIGAEETVASRAKGESASRGGLSERLLPRLSEPGIRADRDTALASMLLLWGVGGGSGVTQAPCAFAPKHGLQCLSRWGGWDSLRGFDLPAVIGLYLKTGEARFVTVTGLNGDRVTLAIDRKTGTYPRADIEPLWNGHFTVVWRPPERVNRLISAGVEDAGVLWLRERLDQLDGRKVQVAKPNLYDEALRERVIAFQHRHALAPDGMIGPETLLYLVTAVPTAGTPSLTTPKS